MGTGKTGAVECGKEIKYVKIMSGWNELESSLFPSLVGACESTVWLKENEQQKIKSNIMLYSGDTWVNESQGSKRH